MQQVVIKVADKQAELQWFPEIIIMKQSRGTHVSVHIATSTFRGKDLCS
jgi:hypothetical protein